MVSIEKIRERCKKEYWGIYNRAVHEVGFYLTKLFINTKVTSNQITVVWLILGIIGAVFLANGEYRWMLIGIILYHLGHFFDCVDGDLARYRNKFTVKGIYLEQISHHLTITAVLIGLTWGVFRISEDILWLYLGSVLVLSFVFSKLCSVRSSDYKEDKRKKIEEVIYESNPRARSKFTTLIFSFVRIEHPLNLIFFLILLDLSWVALFIYTILYFLEMIQKLISTLRKLQKIDDSN